jgi:hypothetical protein
VTELPTEKTAPRGSAPPTLWQRISAYGFLGAFGLTIVTVILTGLEVRSPSARRAPDTQRVTLAAAEPHTVNLLFTSLVPLDSVRFTVDLPPGVEITGRAGIRRVAWSAPLAAGNNLLPLTLVARAGSGGQLAARLAHDGAQKTFVVDVAVAAR